MPYIDSIQKVKIDVRGQQVECVAGSFKGVPFFFDTADYSGGGRNVQTNSIPFSDDHVNEDTGKNVASYSFNIYFIGEDAENKKNEFLRVCGQIGAGELIHPYFGVFRARCKGIDISYGNIQEYISGSVTFVPENDFEVKNVVVSLSGTVRQKAEELKATALNSAKKSFKVTGKKKNVWDSAISMSDDVVSAVYSGHEYMQKAEEYVRDVGKVKANIQAIMLSPDDYLARIQNLVDLSYDAVELEQDSKTEVKSLSAIMLYTPDVDTYDEISSKNKSAMTSLVRMSAAASLSKQLIECEFESVDEAAEYQDLVYDAFEQMLADVDDAELFMLAQSLEAAALKYLRDNLSKVPKKVEIQRKATGDVLSLCNAVYGNLDDVESVIERNCIRNPLFVKPGDRFVVLSND